MTDDFAVRIKDVSKIYQLRQSSKQQFVVTLKQLLAKVTLSKSKTDELPKYKEFYALDNISLDIRQGESWGFIGVNGSGKSTLLKIISGNLRPSSGCVEVDGKVAILDYGSGFNGEFTGKENIYIKATLLGLTRKKINERYQSIIEFAELGDFIDQPVKTYSSGMVSRLGFAIMAHVDADIIITDEALAVGDVFFIQKCMGFIRNFLKKGTFLFVSHSINDVMTLCQKAVWLEQGKVKAIGPASLVAKAYLDRNTKNVVQNAEESLDTDNVVENEKKLIVLGKPRLEQVKVIKNTLDPADKPRDEVLPPPIIEMDGHHDHGGAKILQVTLYNDAEESISQIIGGEWVTLTVEVLAETKLQSPLVGFHVMDRLGQILFAGNSHQQIFDVESGMAFTIDFAFHMPLLPPGSYVIRAAVATMNSTGEMTTLHTANNALALHSVTAGARHGLVGIPMHSIKLSCKSIANG